MRGSVDGFSSQVFHEKCDIKDPTLTVIKANDRVFGGFTNLSWDSNSGGKNGDPEAFVFRVVNIQDQNNSAIEKFNYYRNSVISCEANYCAIFGRGHGHDICLRNNSNQCNNNWSEFGGSFQLPQGIEFNTDAARLHLAGSNKFTVQDYEVFKVLAP